MPARESRSRIPVLARGAALVPTERNEQAAADIIRHRLPGAPESLARRGALGHPDGVEQRGTIPGFPEWEYYFLGRGCRVAHKVDGDRIDVDFFDDSADYFDTFFYECYLRSLRRPEPAEQRLRELHPTASTVSIAVTDLIAGALGAGERS